MASPGVGAELPGSAAASRQSFAAALDALDEFAAGAQPDQLRVVADELLQVAGLLAREIPFRRALSDPARPGQQRAAMLRGLVDGKLSEPTQRLLETLVAGRWSAPSELLDGCERLGVQALMASADRAGDLAEVEDELFRFGQIVAADRGLAAALGDRRVPAARRVTLAEQLLSGKANDVTVRAVRAALGGFGGRNVEAALTRLVELAAQRRDRGVAYVTVAAPLAESEERRLGAALSARYGRDVSVKTTVDPQVLGGVRVQVGSDLYDGTIARRLAQARNALAK